MSSNEESQGQQTEQYVKNPKSGRNVIYKSKTYKQLVKDGILTGEEKPFEEIKKIIVRKKKDDASNSDEKKETKEKKKEDKEEEKAKSNVQVNVSLHGSAGSNSVTIVEGGNKEEKKEETEKEVEDVLKSVMDKGNDESSEKKQQTLFGMLTKPQNPKKEKKSTKPKRTELRSLKDIDEHVSKICRKALVKEFDEDFVAKYPKMIANITLRDVFICSELKKMLCIFDDNDVAKDYDDTFKQRDKDLKDMSDEEVKKLHQDKVEFLVKHTGLSKKSVDLYCNELGRIQNEYV